MLATVVSITLIGPFRLLMVVSTFDLVVTSTFDWTSREVLSLYLYRYLSAVLSMQIAERESGPPLLLTHRAVTGDDPIRQPTGAHSPLDPRGSNSFIFVCPTSVFTFSLSPRLGWITATITITDAAIPELAQVSYIYCNLQGAPIFL